MFTLTNIAIVLFIATAVNLIVSYVGWQRRKTKGGLYFTLAIMGVTIWTFASGLDATAVPIPLKVLFSKFEYIGYNLALLFFDLFILSYAGYEDWLKKTWVRLLFSVAPITNILLAWTNDWHGWLWSRVFRDSDNTVIFEHGPAYIFAIITGYLMIFIMILTLGVASRRGSELSRRQARLLFLSIVIPVMGNVSYLLQWPVHSGVDWGSMLFTISGVLFLLALYGTRLLDIVPIARDQLMNSLSDGVIVLDMQNRIIDMNLAAGHMLDSQPARLIGRQFAEVAFFPRSFTAHPPEREVKTELEIDRVHKSYFDVLHSPLHDGNGNLLGSFITLRNITERKENELRLLQLTQAIEQSPTSVMITNPHGNIVYVNPQLSALTGYAPEEIIGKNPKIVQSGQTPVKIYREMWNTISSGRTWHGEFLNRKKNGDLYWEDAVIAPVIDHRGSIINYIAVKVDVTQRKQAEDALRISEERFRQLVTSAPDAVFGIAVNRNIVFANHQASKLLGYEEDELVGKAVDILVPETFRDRHVGQCAAYFVNPRTRSMAAGRELTATCKDGREIPVEINLSHSSTEKGPLVIAHMRDITERKLAEDALRNANQQLENQLREIESLQASLREQAIRDPLTQLHNRRFLDEAIVQEFHHAERVSESLSIVLLDIDHFKEINDSFGHPAGDACLVSMARLIRQHVRRSDTCCRYGGEEFMLVLPATDSEGAVQYAERLRNLVASEVLMIDGQQIQFTISIGISSYPQHGSTHTEIINKADEALYISKRAGRNRVTIWPQVTNSLQR